MNKVKTAVLEHSFLLKNYSVVGFFSILMACICWSLDAVWRYPLTEARFSPIMIVFFEHSYLLFLSFPLIMSLWMTKRAFFTTDWLWSSFMVGGVGSALATVAFTQAMGLIHPTVVILLQKLQPIVGLFLTKIILKEKFSSTFIRWSLVGLLGVAFLSYPDVVSMLHYSASMGASLQMGKNIMSGYFFALMAVLGWSAATVYGKKLTTAAADWSGVELMAFRYVFGWITLVMLIFVFGLEQQLPLLLWNFTFQKSIVIMVMLSALIGMIFYYKGVRLLPCRRVILAELWFPILALIVNAIFFKIPLHQIQFAGFFLLTIASINIQWRRL